MKGRSKWKTLGHRAERRIVATALRGGKRVGLNGIRPGKFYRIPTELPPESDQAKTKFRRVE